MENVYPIKPEHGDGVPFPAERLPVLTVMFKHRDSVCVLYYTDPGALFMFIRVICLVLLWLLRQVLNCSHEPKLSSSLSLSKLMFFFFSASVIHSELTQTVFC